MVKGEENMLKKALDSLLQRRTTLSVFMLAGGLLSVLSQFGCCFYIYHQPHYPEALRMKE